MKKLIFILTMFSAIGLFGQSASASILTIKNRTVAPLMTNPFTLVTSVELGEFEKDGTVYAVYGNPSTGAVTALTFYFGGGDVYYFYTLGVFRSLPTDPWEIRVYFQPTSSSGILEYKGLLGYY
ncbi:MAG TPA: hypothetical protein VL088_11880 [Pedobacter sp.]|nr:hypothetical protein [Pedobacter sp.]